MATRFVDVSESEIDQFKGNAVTKKTKNATKFEVRLFKRRLIKISLLQVTQFNENWYACLNTFFLCRQLLVTFAKYFVLQNGFNSSKSSQMKKKTWKSMN